MADDSQRRARRMLRQIFATTAILAILASGAKIVSDSGSWAGGFTTLHTAAADPTGPTGPGGPDGQNGQQFQPPGLPPQLPDYQGRTPPLNQEGGVNIYNTPSQGVPQQTAQQGGSRQPEPWQQPIHGEQIPDYSTAPPFTSGQSIPNTAPPQQDTGVRSVPSTPSAQPSPTDEADQNAPTDQNQPDQQRQQECESAVQSLPLSPEDRLAVLARKVGGAGSLTDGPGRDKTGPTQCCYSPDQTAPSKSKDNPSDNTCTRAIVQWDPATFSDAIELPMQDAANGAYRGSLWLTSIKWNSSKQSLTVEYRLPDQTWGTMKAYAYNSPDLAEKGFTGGDIRWGNFESGQGLWAFDPAGLTYPWGNGIATVQPCSKFAIQPQGKVSFCAPANGPPSDAAELQKYVTDANTALQNGLLSPIGRVSPRNTFFPDPEGNLVLSNLEQAAGRAASAEKARDPDRKKYLPGTVAAHMPDTSWVGRPESAMPWFPMRLGLNSSLGAQNNNFPLGMRPTSFASSLSGSCPTP